MVGKGCEQEGWGGRARSLLVCPWLVAQPRLEEQGSVL